MDELIAASGSNLPKSELQKIIEEANRQLAEKTAAMKAEEERRRGRGRRRNERPRRLKRGNGRRGRSYGSRNMRCRGGRRGRDYWRKWRRRRKRGSRILKRRCRCRYFPWGTLGNSSLGSMCRMLLRDGIKV